MKLSIENGRARLYFDGDTAYIRMDYNGAGPAMRLSVEDMETLSKRLWYAAQRAKDAAASQPKVRP